MQTSRLGARRSRSTSQVGNGCSEIAALGVHEMKVPPGSLSNVPYARENKSPVFLQEGVFMLLNCKAELYHNATKRFQGRYKEEVIGNY